MKRFVQIVCLLLLVFVADLALAQVGQLCLFSDPQGLDCSIRDTRPGLLAVYVLHTQSPGATAVQFSAPKPPCTTWTWLSDTYPFSVSLGSSQDGLSVGYGACRSGSIHVVTINYFAQGSTPANCPYEILPHPIFGNIGAVDCTMQELEAAGSKTFINSNYPCTCVVGGHPLLSVDPTMLEFGVGVDTRPLSIANVGGGTLTWSVSESIPWLSASPSSGTGNATITVTVNRVGLPTGTYSGEIAVSSNGGNATIPITMGVLAEPILAVSPLQLYFAAAVSEGALTIYNSGGGTLEWNVTSDQPWLSAAPTSGTANGQVRVYIDREGLSTGAYSGNLSVTSNGGDVTVPVDMIVSDAVLLASPDLLVFNLSTPTNRLSISNGGSGTLNWSLTLFDPWVSAVPMSGSGDAIVTVTVDIGSVPCCNTVIGHIRVDSNGGSEVIELRVYPTGPGHGGSIGIYADTQGTECNLSDAVVGMTTYHVVHRADFGMTACAYWAPKPSCFTATYLADTNVFPVTIGNSQAGVSIGYGSCRLGPIHVQSINFFTQGTTPQCCLYPVFGIPSSGKVEAVDCSNVLTTGHGVTSVINRAASCSCGNIRVEESTWGKVKSLYSE